MPRVKTGTVTRARHKKVMKQAKGYFGSKHRLYKTAKEQVMHSGKYAYRDRKQNKREFRKLWIIRINAACRENDISYSKFINGLTKAGVAINRKMLSEIAIDNKKAFTDLVKIAKDAIEGKVTSSKKESSVKTEKKAEVSTDLSKCTVAELREKAKEKGVEGYSTMKKAEVSTDLSKCTVAELREKAKEKGVEGYSTMKKAELLEALK